jgi:hypothetical protein
MLVTGMPLIVAGMITAPPEPVYPVMVMMSKNLSFTYLNCACTTAGSINSSSSGRSLAATALLEPARATDRKSPS